MLYIYKMNALSAVEQDAFLTAVDRCGEAVCLLDDSDLSRTVTEVLDTVEPVDMRGFIGSKITPLSLAISNMNPQHKRRQKGYGQTPTLSHHGSGDRQTKSPER